VGIGIFHSIFPGRRAAALRFAGAAGVCLTKDGKGHLSRLEEIPDFGVAEDIDRFAIGNAGNKIAHILETGERRQLAQEGLFACALGTIVVGVLAKLVKLPVIGAIPGADAAGGGGIARRSAVSRIIVAGFFAVLFFFAFVAVTIFFFGVFLAGSRFMSFRFLGIFPGFCLEGCLSERFVLLSRGRLFFDCAFLRRRHMETLL
jgi:hypothetical protein